MKYMHLKEKMDYYAAHAQSAALANRIPVEALSEKHVRQMCQYGEVGDTTLNIGEPHDRDLVDSLSLSEIYTLIHHERMRFKGMNRIWANHMRLASLRKHRLPIMVLAFLLTMAVSFNWSM